MIVHRPAQAESYTAAMLVCLAALALVGRSATRQGMDHPNTAPPTSASAAPATAAAQSVAVAEQAAPPCDAWADTGRQLIEARSR